MTDLRQTLTRDLLGSLVRLHRLPEGSELAQLLQLLLSLRGQPPASLLPTARLPTSLQSTPPVRVAVMLTVRLRELLAHIAPRSPSNTQDSHIKQLNKKMI